MISLLVALSLAADPDADLRAVHRLVGTAPAIVWRTATCLTIECPDCSTTEARTIEQVAALYPCILAHRTVPKDADVEACRTAMQPILDAAGPQTDRLTLHFVPSHHRWVLTGSAVTAAEQQVVSSLKAACPSLGLGVLTTR